MMCDSLVMPSSLRRSDSPSECSHSGASYCGLGLQLDVLDELHCSNSSTEVQQLKKQLLQEMELHSFLKNVIEKNAMTLSGAEHLPHHPLSSGSFGTSDLLLCSTSYATSSCNYSGIQGGFAGVDSSKYAFTGIFYKCYSTRKSLRVTSISSTTRRSNAGHESQSTSNSTGKSQPDQFDKKLTELFFLMDSMSLLDEPQEPSNVIALPTESISNLSNELLTLPNRLQLQGSHESMDSDPVGMYMVEDPAQPNNSATYNDQDWDMDLIEALFDTDPPN